MNANELRKKISSNQCLCQGDGIYDGSVRTFMKTRESIDEASTAVTVSAYTLALYKEARGESPKSFRELLDFISTEDELTADIFKRNVRPEDWSALMDLQQFSPESLAEASLGSILQLRRGDTVPFSLTELASLFLNMDEEGNTADLWGDGSFALRQAAKNQVTPSTVVCRNDRLMDRNYICARALGVQLNFAKLGLKNMTASDTLFDKIFCFPSLQSLHKEPEAWYKEISGFPKEDLGAWRPHDEIWLYVLAALSRLRVGGRAAIVLPMGKLFVRSDAEIRHYLLKNKMVEAVVALPNRLMRPALNFALLLLRHGSENVMMVDATKQYKEGHVVNEITSEQREAIVSSCHAASELSVEIKSADLLKGECNLNPSAYVARQKLNLDDTDLLRNITERITRGVNISPQKLQLSKSDKPTPFGYITVSMLNDGLLDEITYLKDLEKKQERYCFDDKTLLLAKNGTQIKVAVVEVPEGQKRLASNNFYIIKVNERKVSPYYLAAFLASEEGEMLLRASLTGAAAPQLSRENLELLPIPLPPREVQERIGRAYLNAQAKIRHGKEILKEGRDELKAAFNA